MSVLVVRDLSAPAILEMDKTFFASFLVFELTSTHKYCTTVVTVFSWRRGNVVHRHSQSRCACRTVASSNLTPSELCMSARMTLAPAQEKSCLTPIPRRPVGKA